MSARAALVALFLVPAVSAAAAPEGTSAGEATVLGLQRPADGIVEIAFDWRGERRLVRVHDVAGDSEHSDDWTRATDFDDDAWVFLAPDGRATIAVVFTIEDGDHVARVYEDQDGDGALRHSWTPGAFRVLETEWPSARAIAPGGWSRSPTDLVILGDGPAPGHSMDRVHQEIGNYRPRTDGRLDLRYSLADRDGDGVADEQVIETFPERDPDDQIQRVIIVLNPRNKPYPIDGYLFWPLLGTGAGALDTTDAERVGPIGVDLDAGRLVGMAEILPSRGNEGNLWIYSLKAFPTSGRHEANFENPYAFYDLDGVDDGTPELVVRFEYYPAHDPQFLGGSYGRALEKVRYAWDADGDADWDFKVSTVGHHEMNGTVRVGAVDVVSLPHDVIPRWVLDAPWDAGCDLVVSADGVVGSEGIYDWDPDRGWFEGIATGRATSTTEFDAIAPGLRGEYRLAPCDPPTLVASPVDRAVHLEGAEGGRETLADGSVVVLGASGGPTVDEWTLLAPGGTRVEAALHYPDRAIALLDASGLHVRDIAVPAALWRALPPADAAGYADLRARTSALGPALATPGAIFDATPAGAEIAVANVVAWARAGPDALRFTVGAGGGAASAEAGLVEIPALLPAGVHEIALSETGWIVRVVALAADTDSPFRAVPVALAALAAVAAVALIWRLRARR